MDAATQTTLNAEITALLASPATDQQKALVMESLIMGALAQLPTANPSTAITAAQEHSANIAALAAVRPDASAGLGAQSDLAQQEASTFAPSDPTDDDLGNPPGYANRMFTAAGYTNVNAADGPVERWGSLLASRGALSGQPVDVKARMKQAVVDIIATYAAGTANMQPVAPSQPESIQGSQSAHTARQVMTALYTSTAAPGRPKAMTALDAELGGDGVHENATYNALVNLVGPGGGQYDPAATAAMSQLAQGSSRTAVAAAFPQFDSAWFDLAASVIAAYQ